jgi:inorganic phosphate transporter, PiT family
MINTLGFVYFVVFLAFIFDFINGIHDAANSVATIVATRMLKPLSAVLWAAFFNGIAFLFFKLNVANTIGSGLVLPGVVTPYLVFSALTGAIGWNLLTWYFALPSSSSHALIGGLIGSAFITAGWQALNWQGLLPVLFALVLSPILGLLMSMVLLKLVSFVLPDSADVRLIRWTRRVQFIAAAFLSLGHGGNDAQKTMGIIAVLLFSAGLLGENFHVPFWLVISCNLVMGLGTLLGGWRIIYTMGEKITLLTPLSGSCASTGAAVTLLAANQLGVPVSTTHTVTGAIVGTGISKGWSGIYWPTVYQILWAWLLTIPSAAVIAASVMSFSHFLVK